MIDPISEARYQEIAFYCEGQELYHIWHDLIGDVADFGERREALLWVVHRLLEDGRVDLVNMHTHVPLGGAFEDQIDRLRQAFPKDDTEMNNGIWFFTDACPGGSAWRFNPDS